MCILFFFSSRRRHTRWPRDWSSDVCSSDLCGGVFGGCSDGPVFHGTHVSGILMARDNSIGVVGVAPGLANNDVYSWGACNPVPGGGCDASAIAAGITAAINNEIGRASCRERG